MADFCHQCSLEVFGEDYKDLAGLSTQDDTEADRYAHAICEHCGPTLVDHTGKCVYAHCMEKHGDKT